MSYKKIYMSFNIKRHIHARVIFKWKQRGNGEGKKQKKHIRICHHSSGCVQRRMVSKESECMYPMRKDSTAPPNFLCRST